MATGSKNSVVQLRYFQWEEIFHQVKPYQIRSTAIVSVTGLPATNFETHLGPKEIIHDLRGYESEFSLDENGFQIEKHDFGDLLYGIPERVNREYLPQVADLLRRVVLGADEVIIYDWKIRENKTVDPQQPIILMHGKSMPQPPDRIAHVDMTPATACCIIRQIKGSEFDAAGKRIRFINVWRPYESVVKDCPLAICDGRTVDIKSLVAIDSISKRTNNEIYLLAYDKRAKWFYLNSQRPDELLLFKNFDSENSVQASRAPHAAFDLPKQDGESVPRKSIEVRACVITH